MYPSEDMTICDKLVHKCTKMITLQIFLFLWSSSLKHLFYKQYFTYIPFTTKSVDIIANTMDLCINKLIMKQFIKNAIFSYTKFPIVPETQFWFDSYPFIIFIQGTWEEYTGSGIEAEKLIVLNKVSIYRI